MLSVMCGRSTYKLTWEEIVALYRLTLDQPARNTQARYNVCPTTTIDTIVGQNGSRREKCCIGARGRLPRARNTQPGQRFTSTRDGAPTDM